MATKEEIAAGVAAIMPTLNALIDQYVPDMFGYRQRMHATLNAEQGQELVGESVIEVIKAVDLVRQGHQPPEPKLHSALLELLRP